MYIKKVNHQRNCTDSVIYSKCINKTHDSFSEYVHKLDAKRCLKSCVKLDQPLPECTEPPSHKIQHYHSSPHSEAYHVPQ